MSYKSFSRLFLLLVLAAMLLSAGCNVPTGPAAVPTAAPTMPVTAPTTPSTTVEAVQQVVTQAPTEAVNAYVGPFTDAETLVPAVLQALMDRDTEKLMTVMRSDFMTCYWRADGAPSDPAYAVQEIYDQFWGEDVHLEWVKDADLQALMGGADPLSCGYSNRRMEQAVLISGFGKDGRDEFALTLARDDDNSLRWAGWIRFKGGISGARLGGNQHYVNDKLGISFYVPKDYEIQLTEDGRVLIIAPGPSERPPFEERAAALVETQPANGRTVQEVADQVKADAGPGFNETTTMMGLDKAPAIVFDGLPGQDPNRQLFVVYNDLLYHITFAPNNPLNGADYVQMEDLYAMMINTFHFTK
jgi:hypothetical protein